MSIVFLQGGGLSQDQMDHVPMNRARFLPMLAGWFAALIAKPVCKD